MPLCYSGVCLSLLLIASEASAQHVLGPNLQSSHPPEVRFDSLKAQAGDLPPLPGIGAVVKEMPLDLWRFLSVDTALVLGVGGAAAGIAHIWDDDLKQEVDTNPQFNNALDPGHTYGAFGFQAAVGIGLYGIGGDSCRTMTRGLEHR